MEELLFFDTFSHDINRHETFEDQQLNLDLVQFPNPVFVTECRIIPLGARVDAEFPGGTHRLGATNPSKFHVNFYVNDLTKTQTTFETFGSFDYNQNDLIHIAVTKNSPIPTDGLVLMGEYTTITLAVYGILTKNVVEPILEPLVPKYTEPPESKHEMNWCESDMTLMKETLVFEECCYNDQPKDPRTDLRLISPELDNSGTTVSVTVSPDSPGSRNYGRRSQSDSRNELYSLQNKRPQTPPQLQNLEISSIEDRPPAYEEIQQDITIIQGSINKNYLEENATMITPQIQFEPILSDEEIADEINEHCLDEFDAMVQESVLITFDPYSTIQITFNSNETSDIIDDQFTELTQIINSNMKKFPNLKADVFQEQKKWLLFVEDELLYSFQKLTVMNYEVINQRLETFFNEKPAARHFLKEIIKIGLSYDISVIEPHVHLRHIQTGLQLVQSVSMYECILKELIQHSYNIFETLFFYLRTALVNQIRNT